ncbi:MAG TPA: hypothetical protein VFU46_10000 [Gemmatimonadales bacterium]|nr:hypothetical protein [Gemmatimonadales bacterium]
MSGCDRLSDRMGAVAGGAAWTAEEQAHLEACGDCRAEWVLLAAARRLGADIPAALDEHHVTQRVLGRLRADRAVRRGRRAGLALAAVAAALALAVWSGGAGSGRPGQVELASALVPLPELDSLRTPELEALLRTMDRPLDESVTDVEQPGLGELDAGELDRVLEAMEG